MKHSFNNKNSNKPGPQARSPAQTAVVPKVFGLRNASLPEPKTEASLFKLLALGKGKGSFANTEAIRVVEKASSTRIKLLVTTRWSNGFGAALISILLFSPSLSDKLPTLTGSSELTLAVFAGVVYYVLVSEFVRLWLEKVGLQAEADWHRSVFKALQPELTDEYDEIFSTKGK